MPGKAIHVIRLHLRGSPGLAGWLAAAYGGGVLAVWGSALPTGAAAALSVLAAAGILRDLRRHVVRSARNAVVWLEAAPEPRIGLASGEVRSARLRGSAFVHPWLVIVPLGAAGGPRSVVVPADSLPAPSAHRTLRRLLRQRGSS